MKAYLEIEMPTNCAHCMMWSICPALPNDEWSDYESILTNDVIGDGGVAPGIRLPDCPLVPIPPHGRLGDLDKLENGLRHMAKYQHGERQQGILGCCETIRLAPTVLEAEEVYGQYTDTAGNFHWCGTHSGEHIIKAEEGQ